MTGALKSIFARLTAPKWPEGEPLIKGSIRWGTRLPDGSLLLAPGVSFTPINDCILSKSELHQADNRHRQSDSIKQEAGNAR
jgi:hypothetical protein